MSKKIVSKGITVKTSEGVFLGDMKDVEYYNLEDFQDELIDLFGDPMVDVLCFKRKGENELIAVHKSKLEHLSAVYEEVDAE